MHAFKAYKPLLAFSIVANVLMLVAPLHMMQVYDRVLSSGSGETLLYITLIGAACLVLYGVSEAIRSIVAQRISASYYVDHAEPLFRGMTNGAVPVEKSDEIIRNFGTVRAFISSRVMIGLFDLPFAPFFLVLLFALHFQLGLITALGVAVLIGIAWLNKKTTHADQEKASGAQAEATGFASAITKRSEDIRSMGLLPELVGRWGKITGESLNAQDASAHSAGIFFGISKAFRQILQISIMAWGAWLVLQGDMSGGMIFAASMISQRALQPIEQVIGGWDQINRARKAHQAVEDVLNKVGDMPDKITQPAPKGDLKISGVSLSVEGKDGELPILQDISFSVKPGELVAIVGPSGAGKSTLARIIAGATDATTGDVSLDGCSQQNWPVEQWGKYVGYVGQDVALFPGTIADNIARMAVEPDEKRIVSAARFAGAHELINSFPNGYMTDLADGFRLSGGQKQRIALARALYSGPKLLVLDEPNAHLDREGEMILMQSLQAVKKHGVAILVVAQRQQILRIADKVLMIKDGQQADFGTAKKEEDVKRFEADRKSEVARKPKPDASRRQGVPA